MVSDIHWYTETCHICQLCQSHQVLIPPVITTTPAPIFARAYIDTMHMPPSGVYKYIVQDCCSLFYYPEFRMLRVETARTLGDWIYEDILCWRGSPCEIVTDNGPAFLTMMEYLSMCYHLNHIQISRYNSQANGTVECSHFDVCWSLFNIFDGDQKRLSLGLYSVFWEERVTPRKCMGCSPYFAITGAHPILPFNIAKATYLQLPPTSIMSSYPNTTLPCKMFHQCQCPLLQSLPKLIQSSTTV
jgi:hypothetical protein